MSISQRQQRTLASPVKVSGIGYWSGKKVNVEFRPAASNDGVVFVRSDLDQPARIPARVANRIEMPRRTTLNVNGKTVEMVEHILAALAGLQIDNCEVWVDAAEMPGCDGSSQMFVDALTSVKVTEQDAIRPIIKVTETTRVGDDQGWVEAKPADHFSIKCRIDYLDNRAIGQQTFSGRVTPKMFQEELSSARTFLLEHEANWLRDQGLGKHVTLQDVLVFNDDGPIDNPLRFENECVRHKALDLIGDLALSGCDLLGSFTAYCSGHRQNAEMAKALLSSGLLISDADDATTAAARKIA